MWDAERFFRSLVGLKGDGYIIAELEIDADGDRCFTLDCDGWRVFRVCAAYSAEKQIIEVFTGFFTEIPTDRYEEAVELLRRATCSHEGPFLSHLSLFELDVDSVMAGYLGIHGYIKLPIAHGRLLRRKHRRLLRALIGDSFHRLVTDMSALIDFLEDELGLEEIAQRPTVN